MLSNESEEDVFSMSSPTDSAYRYIKQRILDGTYTPSQKLTESDLAETIGVSRNTVKKAFLTLQQENLVRIEQNKGAFIKSFTLQEVRNYLEIREVLEGLVVRTSTQNLTGEQVERLGTILAEMGVHLENNRFDEYSGLNREFHNIIYAASENGEAVEMINMIKTQLLRYHFRTLLVPGRNKESFEDHQRIVEALKSRDKDQAEKAVCRHVANLRRTIEDNYHYLI